MHKLVAEKTQVAAGAGYAEGSSGLFASPGKRKFVLSLALVAMTLLVYAPIRNYPFINYDDNLYVTQNIQVQSGLNWKSIAWAFTTVEAANYHPIAWLSHELDVELFGLNPAGHHLTSVLLHSLNAVLLFLLLARATGSIWRSLAVAALFAVHPLNVQSVAWISERKNLLSTLFGLATLWAYGWYAMSSNWKRYLSVIALFVLSLLSKPMLVTLPFALLLLDYWPLRRFPATLYAGDAESHEHPPEITFPRCPVRQLVAEKIPLLALVGASSWVTYKAQLFELGAKLHVPFLYRIENAIFSYGDYLFQMVWPVRLGIFYPHPRFSIAAWQIVLASLLLVILTVAVVAARRRAYLMTGWFWFLGTLVPVIGLVQVGSQGKADRYVYLPLWGVFVMLVWFLADLAGHRKSRRMLAATAVIIVVALCWAARIQLGYWQDSATLFARSLEVSPNNNYISHANLGNALMNLGKYDQAALHLRSVLQHFPNAASVRNDYGTDLLLQGEARPAMEQFALAIPDAEGLPILQSSIQANLGMAQEQAGETQRAIASYREALRLNPLFYNARVSLGLLLFREGRPDEAIAQFQASIQTLPTALAYDGLGHALQLKGQMPAAAAAYRAALKLEPGMQGARAALDEISKTPGVGEVKQK